MADYNMNDFAINYPPAGGNPTTPSMWGKVSDWLGSPQAPIMLGQLGAAVMGPAQDSWQAQVGKFGSQLGQSRIAAEQAAQAQAQKQSFLAQLLSGLGDKGQEGPTTFTVSKDDKTGNYLMNVKSTLNPDQLGVGGGQAGGGGGGGAGNYQYTAPLPTAQTQQTQSSFNPPTLGSLLQGNQALNQSYKTYPF